MTVRKEVMEIKEKIPIMTYSQYRRARKLVHQCCNYERGNCLALDNGLYRDPTKSLDFVGRGQAAK